MSRRPSSRRNPSHRIALLVSGASGMLLPRRVLATLARHPGVERIHLVVSRGASQVLQHEMPDHKPGAAGLLDAMEAESAARDEITIHRDRITTHRDNELDAPIASGSYRLDGTLVMPCSAGTLGALATGSSRTLVHRAGAVALKEGWPLVLGFRETPLSLMHIENMRRLVHAGAVVLPPVPAFYVGGEDLGRFLDHYTLRVLDRLGLPEVEATDLRWGEEGTGDGDGTTGSEGGDEA